MQDNLAMVITFLGGGATLTALGIYFLYDLKKREGEKKD